MSASYHESYFSSWMEVQTRQVVSTVFWWNDLFWIHFTQNNRTQAACHTERCTCSTGDNPSARVFSFLKCDISQMDFMTLIGLKKAPSSAPWQPAADFTESPNTHISWFASFVLQQHLQTDCISQVRVLNVITPLNGRSVVIQTVRIVQMGLEGWRCYNEAPSVSRKGWVCTY